MRLLQTLHQCDLTTFDWCLRRKHIERLTQLARPISHSADGHLYALTLIALLLLSEQGWGYALLAALLIERPLYTLLKAHFRRNRPPQAIPGFQSVIVPSDQFSFPSGHTSAAFLFATVCNAILPGVGWLLYPWAVMVGMSRVVLGVHFPTDTLAGAVLGTSAAVIGLSLLH